MDGPEPFALTSSSSPRCAADLVLPATVTGLVGAGIGAVGVLAAPVIFVVQRKRSARALPPSIR